MNLESVSQVTTTAVALSNLILVSPQKTVGYQPQNAPSWQKDSGNQGPALLFNYEGEQTATLTSDITDHFIENNTAIQDQIALKPVLITTHGFVGELNDIAPAALVPLKFAAEKLTPISAYAPSLSTTAQLAYTNAFQLYQVSQNLQNSAISAWASINGTGGENVINGSGQTTSATNQTKQQVYFQQLFGYWQNRQLFTIQTPWAIFQDMAIQSLRAIQDDSTRMITDFEVTFKMLRFASTQAVSQSTYDQSSFQGRTFNQGASEVDLGTSTLEPASASFKSAAFNFAPGVS
jgi:hypothetical protein